MKKSSTIISYIFLTILLALWEYGLWYILALSENRSWQIWFLAFCGTPILYLLTTIVVVIRTKSKVYLIFPVLLFLILLGIYVHGIWGGITYMISRHIPQNTITELNNWPLYKWNLEDDLSQFSILIIYPSNWVVDTLSEDQDCIFCNHQSWYTDVLSLHPQNDITNTIIVGNYGFVSENLLAGCAAEKYIKCDTVMVQGRSLTIATESKNKEVLANYNAILYYLNQYKVN